MININEYLLSKTKTVNTLPSKDLEEIKNWLESNGVTTKLELNDTREIKSGELVYRIGKYLPGSLGTHWIALDSSRGRCLIRTAGDEKCQIQPDDYLTIYESFDVVIKVMQATIDDPNLDLKSYKKYIY